MKEKLYYISEASIPSSSAYSIHVAKMCEAFAGLNFNVCLIVPNSQNKFKFYSKYYNINFKYKLISIFKCKINLNFINRLFIFIQSFKFFKKTIFIT